MVYLVVFGVQALCGYLVVVIGCLLAPAMGFSRSSTRVTSISSGSRQGKNMRQQRHILSGTSTPIAFILATP